VRIPPRREKTAVLNHHGITGSSATVTYQGIPTKISVNRPITKAIEPNCLIIFIALLLFPQMKTTEPTENGFWKNTEYSSMPSVINYYEKHIIVNATGKPQLN
jgi:hypothetical protein